MNKSGAKSSSEIRSASGQLAFAKFYGHRFLHALFNGVQNSSSAWRLMPLECGGEKLLPSC
jgi:hypothetical protein